MTQVGPFLPVSTLVIGAKEHVEHHKVLHAWFNEFMGGDPGGGNGGGADIHWVAPARAISDTYTGPYVFSGVRSIFGALVYARIPPTGDRTCVLDLLLNDTSLWSDPNDRPTLSAADTKPKKVLLTTPITTAELDVITGYIAQAGGVEGLFLGVLLGAAATPTP